MIDPADPDDFVTVHRQYLPRPGWSLDLPDYEAGRRILDILERTRLMTKRESDAFVAALGLRWTAPLGGETGGSDPRCAQREETTMETRRMQWDDEGSLFTELQWLASGGHPYEERSEEDRALAQALIDRHVENTHPEPDGLGEYDESIYERLTEGEIDSLEERLATVEVTWPAADWAVADRLLAGVELVAGYRFSAPRRSRADEGGDPDESGVGADVAAAPEDSAPVARWFTWETAEALLEELGWLARGPRAVVLPHGGSRPLNAAEARGVPPARDALLDALPHTPADDPTPFAVTLPAGTWALVDALCAGVDFGWGVGFVGAPSGEHHQTSTM